jgi:hypothetical protein
MNQETTQSKNAIKPKHREAWCHMKYFGKSRAGQIMIKIWNSRDGVTPFITYNKEFGIKLQHINWQEDVCEPFYKPKKGDLIWRDLTIEEAIEFGKKKFNAIKKDLAAMEKMTLEEIKAKFPWTPPEYLQEIIDKGENAWIDEYLKSIQPGSPHLELIKEDWK